MIIVQIDLVESRLSLSGWRSAKFIWFLGRVNTWLRETNFSCLLFQPSLLLCMLFLLVQQLLVF